MRELIYSGLTALDLTPSSTTVDQLTTYGDMLLEQNKVMNLTAITEPSQVVALHFLDSISLLRGTDFVGKKLIDVGTGAGFPGLPLKIMEPSIHLTLLDGLGKRVDWLAQVGQSLGLEHTTYLHGRGEEQSHLPHMREQFDIATARAVAPLSLLCELCLPFVVVGGRFLAMKSVDSDEELAQSQQAIQLLGGKLLPSYDYTIPGTNVTHRVIVIEKTAQTPSKYPRRWAKMQKTPL